MSSVHLRPVRDTDWPALLELANQSVAHVPPRGLASSLTPSSRLPALGELLYARGVELLRALGALRVSLTEYAADEPLLSFMRAHGFRELRRFPLPEGLEAVTLVKDLVGQGATA
jgi:hypothetical protein